MKILVLAVRGLHLGYLGCYGNDWLATPALDRLAAEGIVFDQHFADCPNAMAAARAWRTGRFHFPPMGNSQSLPADDSVDLVRILKDRHIAHSLVRDCSRLPSPDPAEEWLTGWDHITRIPLNAMEGTPLERTLSAVLNAMDKVGRSERCLIWCDLATLLPSWDIPEQFLEPFFGEEDEEAVTPLLQPECGPVADTDDDTIDRLQMTYAAAAAYLDSGLESLLDELRERIALDEMMIVFTSDHGFPLGEHGVVGTTRPWLHEELVHLPLIVRLPGAAEAGLRITALTQPVDLMPTLLAALELPQEQVHGHSLLPLIHGEVERIRPYVCMGFQQGAAVEWALRSPEWAFLLPGQVVAGESPRSPQLHVRPDDRWEVNNVYQHHLDLAERLEQTVRAFVTATRQPGPLQVPPLPDLEAERAAHDKGNQPSASP